MACTVINLDDDALAAAAAELGTSTKVATVNHALRDSSSAPPRTISEIPR